MVEASSWGKPAKGTALSKRRMSNEPPPPPPPISRATRALNSMSKSTATPARTPETTAPRRPAPAASAFADATPPPPPRTPPPPPPPRRAAPVMKPTATLVVPSAVIPPEAQPMPSGVARPAVSSLAASAGQQPLDFVPRPRGAVKPREEVEALVRGASARKSEETGEVRRKEIKARLMMAVLSLGTTAVLPGDEAERKTVDSLVRQLEAMTPLREPLGSMHPTRDRVRSSGARRAVYDWEDSSEFDAVVTYDSDSDPDEPASSSSSSAGPAPELLGEWALVYASNGTVVTRTAPAQVLAALSTLPVGIGIESITQNLQVSQCRSVSTQS